MSFTYVPRPAEAWANRAHQTFTGEKKTAPTSPGFVETRRPYIRCANCGHWRAQHCTRRKLKSGQVLSDANWRGFVDDDGQIQPCSHTLPDAKPYACDSAACTVRLGSGDAETYCACKKFVSPNAKKRVAKPRAPKTPKALPDEARFGTLIPKADLLAAHRQYLKEEGLKTKEAQLLAAATETDLTALTAKQIAEITGMTQVQVRGTLKKIGITLPRASREGTAFMTGGSQ